MDALLPDEKERKRQEQEQYISDIARADGQHDFGSLGPVFDKPPMKINIFNSSVLTPARNPYDERRTLKKLLNTAGDFWAESLLREMTGEGGGERREIERFINDVKYTIKSFQLEYEEGKIIPGVDLARNMGLGERSAFVVDMNQHGVLARLKHGGKPGDASLQTIYHLITPEVMNDPAGKTPRTDSVFNAKTGGIDIIPCVEVRQSSIVFPGGRSFDVSEGPPALFYTKYATTVSPLLGVKPAVVAAGAGVGGNPAVIPAKLAVNLTIKDEAQNRTLFVENSKTNNSIGQILKFLTKIYKRFIGGIAQKQFDVASSWLQKRSGDWLQAIAARDITGRTFLNGRNPAEEPFPIPDRVPVYFVTHDQIACAYALAIGCNVIFLSPKTTDVSFAFNREGVAKAALKPILEDDEKFKELQRRIDKITQKIANINTVLGGLDVSFLNEPEFLKVLDVARLKPGDRFPSPPPGELAQFNQDARKIFTTMIKRTYAYKCLQKYEQLKNGLESEDPATQHSSFYYSDKEKEEFDISPIEKEPMYDQASKWEYGRSKPRDRKSKAETPIEYFDFLVYIGSLPEKDREEKKTILNKFKQVAAYLKSILLNPPEGWRDNRPYESASAGFHHITELINTYLILQAEEPVPAPAPVAVPASAPASASASAFASAVSAPALFAPEFENMLLLAELSSDMLELADAENAEYNEYLKYRGIEEAEPTDVRGVVGAEDIDLSGGMKRAADNSVKRQESTKRVAVATPQEPTETIDIRISQIDRIAPIIRRLNTLGIDLDIYTAGNNAFLLSANVAILGGLEGIIEKLEGSPDIATYQHYLRLVESIFNAIVPVELRTRGGGPSAPSKLTPNQWRQFAWEFLTGGPEHREQIAGLFGISKEEYMLTGMISFGISQSLFGDVREKPTLIYELDDGSLKEIWEASKQGTAMNYEQIVEAYQNLRKDTFSRISKSVIKYPSPPPAPAVQATTPPTGDEPMSAPAKMKTGRPIPGMFSPFTQPMRVAATGGRKTYRKKTKHSKTSRGLKTYRKKPKRSKSSRHTRRVRRPGLSKEFETQVSP